MRETPMRRGGRLRFEALARDIATEIETQGVPARLANRVARQLLVKFDVSDLGDRATWTAVGRALRDEMDQLRERMGLVERQMIVALPKLSAIQIEAFLNELRKIDADIARTILNAALDAADPLSAGRHYLAEYHRVAQYREALDAGVARTLANATFMAHAPREKSIRHLKKFARLLEVFRNDVECARTVARAACRAPDPIEAARHFVSTYEMIVNDLTSAGVESQIARTVAGIASTAADPPAAAAKLLQNFEQIVSIVQRTHPSVARSIALAACRASDPQDTARVYMANYDLIVRVIGRLDAKRAHVVAAQAFRSNEPLRWAKRYLAQLQASTR
jgi:hypothetical protein